MDFNGVDIGLLRFCLQHSDGGNLKESQVPARDPKDYEWLRTALGNLESDAQKMKKCIELLNGMRGDASPATTQQKEATLDELLYYVEELHNATDLYKIGGLPVLIDLMTSDESTDSVKMGACWVLGTSLQNNPAAQKTAFEGGVLEAVLKLLATTRQGGEGVGVRTEDEGIQTNASIDHSSMREKALFTISGLIKDFPAALDEFLKRDGLYILATFLQHPKASTRMKAAFILTQITRSKPDIIREIVRLNIVAPLVACVDDPDDDAREKAVGFLEVLLAQSKEVKEKCKEMQLQTIIEERVKKLETEDKNKEDVAQQVGILKHLQQTFTAK